MADRGLAYGDGLFETLRVVAGSAPLADWHWQRLQAGAGRLGLRCDKAEWQTGLARLLRDHPRKDGIAKLIFTAGEGGRGYVRPVSPQPLWHWSWHPLVLRSDTQYRDGLTLALADVRLADQPRLAGLKHLNRLEQVLARKDMPPGVDEVLLCDALGRPHSLSAMNLFARFGQTLWTPSVARAGVAGVVRRLLLEQWLEGSGLTASEQPLSLRELARADEVFAGNAVAGILPVAQLGLVHWSAGKSTRHFQDCYRQALGLLP